MENNNWNKKIRTDQANPVQWVAAEQTSDQSFLSKKASLARILTGFTPLTLSQMDSVALQDRIDTKYVLTVDQLRFTLPYLANDYRILEVERHRMNHYRTLYFDTPEFRLYKMHVNGWADRYKVRSREYTDSQQSFLEVKHKTRKDRTIKERINTDQALVRITPAAEHWLEGVLPMDCGVLEPKIWNSFTRITLVGSNSPERVTIDLDVTFSSESKIVALGSVAIAEVKLPRRGCQSSFIELMQFQRIQPQSFSKYCIGTSMLYEHVKKNVLKPQLMKINKLIAGA